MDPPATAKVITAADATAPSTPDSSQDQKRRSSSRSIKRKRFDDEIVEYSLGLPPAQVNRLGNRARTQSQTLVLPASAATPPTTIAGSAIGTSGTAVSESSASTSTPTGVAANPTQTTTSVSASSAIPAPAAGSVSTPSALTKSAAHAAAATAASVATELPTSSSAVVASSVASVPSASATAADPMMSQTQAATSVASGSGPALPEKRRAAKNASTPAAAPAAGSVVGKPGTVAHPPGAVVNSNNAPLQAVASTHVAGHAGPPASKKSKKSTRVGQQPVSTKDLGRWKPIDDLALILGVQQTNDLRMVHRGIKFSCKFTVQELQSRWYSLMYEETISRLAVAAMRNLHPELVEAVQAKALYTTQEEELLGSIKSNESPTLETFQDLLDRNALVFYSSRTAKALHTHWQLMKQYTLLPDQQTQLIATASAAASASGSSIGGSRNIEPTGSVPAKMLTFDEAEAELNDAELLAEQHDDTVELELTLADRCNKKEIRMLENELTRWTVLVDSLTGVGFIPEFDNQTLAVLRGRLVRYLMRSREISFGRTTKDQAVDVDLSLEGPAHKASRRQGTIKLRSNGDFFIVNEGKRPLFIDGAPLLQGNKGRLGNNAVIEMAGLRFIFLINNDLINAIRQESAKMSGPLS